MAWHRFTDGNTGSHDGTARIHLVYVRCHRRVVTCVFTDNIVIQLAVFVVISLAALIATRPLVKRFKQRNKAEYTNVDMNIGKTVRVLTEINNDKGMGEIKIGDTIWMARTIDGSVIPSGEPVIIQAVEGVKMMVVPQKTAAAK